MNAKGRHESEVKAQGGHESEVKAQGGQEEDVNSVHDESHVSNRHMTWWQYAWWVRVDNGQHMRSAKGRRRTWRAAMQAAEQVRNGNLVGETREGDGRGERQNRKNNEATFHLILHVSQQQQEHPSAQQHQQQRQQQQQSEEHDHEGANLVRSDRQRDRASAFALRDWHFFAQ